MKKHKNMHFISLITQVAQAVETILKEKDLFVVHSQYYGWWWLGDARSQGISCHGIDLDLW